MIKNNLKFINKKFSEKLLLSFNKISSSAKKSAVMCLFLEKNNKIYLILTKRSEKLNQHAGEVSFPGGSLENQDKNSLMAAFRETYEQIGMEALILRSVYYEVVNFAVKDQSGEYGIWSDGCLLYTSDAADE